MKMQNVRNIDHRPNIEHKVADKLANANITLALAGVAG